MCYIEDLRKLTEDLPPIPKLEDFKKALEDNGPCVEYEVEGGEAIACSLFSDSRISVAKTQVLAGTKFPEHNHDEKEFIILYSGTITVVSESEEKVYNVGDVLIFEPQVAHTVTVIEDTEFIAITVPYSKDFPDAKCN